MLFITFSLFLNLTFFMIKKKCSVCICLSEIFKIQAFFPSLLSQSFKSGSGIFSSLLQLLMIVHSPCSQCFGCSCGERYCKQLLCNPRNFEDSHSQTKQSDLKKQQQQQIQGKRFPYPWHQSQLREERFVKLCFKLTSYLTSFGYWNVHMGQL